MSHYTETTLCAVRKKRENIEMKRIILLSLLSVMIGNTVNGRIYERLRLKDGSIIEGYITSQKPGKTICFHAERTQYVVKADRYKVIDRDVSVEELSSGWKEWMEENPRAVKVEDGKRCLTLSRLAVKERDAVDSVAVDTAWVRITERGAMLKYVDVTARDCTLGIDEVKVLERVAREENMRSGLNDVIETVDGTVCEGQIVEQRIGESIRLLGQDGVTRVIMLRDIATQRKQPNNAGQDIFEQTPFVDVIDTGKEKTEGIVTYQKYGTAREKAYLYVLCEDRREHRVEIADIREMRKVENEKYKPQKVGDVTQ